MFSTVLLALVFVGVSRVAAHPIIENGVDVVIAPDRVVVDARISVEELLLVAPPDPKLALAEQWPAMAARHATYVRDHLHLSADGQRLTASVSTLGSAGGLPPPGDAAHPGQPVAYHLEYALPKPPATVTLEQDFLRGIDTWAASFVLRERQSTQATFDQGMLSSQGTAEFDCTWDAAPAAQPSAAAPSDANANGKWHFLTGYHHRLIVIASVVGALVIAVFLVSACFKRSQPSRSRTRLLF